MDVRETSRPTRGAWIEIINAKTEEISQKSRAPHGARGLKFRRDGAAGAHDRRAPHGARGLKYAGQRGHQERCWSRPTRGAWIEMSVSKPMMNHPPVAPHTGRVD